MNRSWDRRTNRNMIVGLALVTASLVGAAAYAARPAEDPHAADASYIDMDLTIAVALLDGNAGGAPAQFAATSFEPFTFLQSLAMSPASLTIGPSASPLRLTEHDGNYRCTPGLSVTLAGALARAEYGNNGASFSGAVRTATSGVSATYTVWASHVGYDGTTTPWTRVATAHTASNGHFTFDQDFGGAKVRVRVTAVDRATTYCAADSIVAEVATTATAPPGAPAAPGAGGTGTEASPSRGTATIALTVSGPVSARNISEAIRIRVDVTLTPASGAPASRTVDAVVPATGGALAAAGVTFADLPLASLQGTNRLDVRVTAAARDISGHTVTTVANAVISKDVASDGRVSLSIAPATFTSTTTDRFGDPRLTSAQLAPREIGT